MEAIDTYTDALEDALNTPELEEELERLTGEFEHPYLKEIPLNLSVEDVCRFRDLQRKMIQGEGRFDAEAVELLTAGKMSLDYRISSIGITADEMRDLYSDLPEVIGG